MNRFSKMVLLFSMLISLVSFSCKTTEVATIPDEAPKKDSGFKIGNLSWIIDQVEPEFWAKDLKMKNKMFISFALEYQGKFDFSALQSLVIDAPSDYYIIEGDDLKKVLEVEKDKILCKRLPCGRGEGKVGLGEWIFTMTLKNGKKIVKTSQVYVFQNNDETSKTKRAYIVPKAQFKNEISALDVPKILSVSKDEDSIEIYFSVNDSRVKNGYFWFDVPGEKDYRDAGSVVDGKGNPVNGCRKFSTDGAKCRFILRRDAENAEWFDKATACCFVVSDVNRVTDPWNERIRSISSLIKIQ